MGRRYYRKPYRPNQYGRNSGPKRYGRRVSFRDMLFLGAFGFAGVVTLGNWLSGDNPNDQALGFTSAISENVYYRRCADARRAGAAPIYRGQPGYRSELDADHDGIACEPYRGRY